jgi:hypothetical protein
VSGDRLEVGGTGWGDGWWELGINYVLFDVIENPSFVEVRARVFFDYILMSDEGPRGTYLQYTSM